MEQLLFEPPSRAFLAEQSHCLWFIATNSTPCSPLTAIPEVLPKLTGAIRSLIDAVWDAFWSGGISNALEVIKQITYLLFMRRLDELQTLEENRSRMTKKPMERQIFPDGVDAKGTPYESLRWSRFKHFDPKTMYESVGEKVFPFLRTLGKDGSTCSAHMEGARGQRRKRTWSCCTGHRAELTIRSMKQTSTTSSGHRTRAK